MLCWSLWWASFAAELFLQVMNDKLLSNKNCFLLSKAVRTAEYWECTTTSAIVCPSDCSEWGSKAWPSFVSVTASYPAHYSSALRLMDVENGCWKWVLKVDIENGYFLHYSQSHNWPFKLGKRIPDTSYGKNAQCSSPLSLLFKAFRKPLTFTPTLKQAHTSTQS